MHRQLSRRSEGEMIALVRNGRTCRCYNLTASHQHIIPGPGGLTAAPDPDKHRPYCQLPMCITIVITCTYKTSINLIKTISAHTFLMGSVIYNLLCQVGFGYSNGVRLKQIN